MVSNIEVGTELQLSCPTIVKSITTASEQELASASGTPTADIKLVHGGNANSSSQTTSPIPTQV